MLSAFQSIMPAQLSVRIIMSPSENFLKLAQSADNCHSIWYLIIWVKAVNPDHAQQAKPLLVLTDTSKIRRAC